MKRTAALFALFSAFSILSFAESWHGRLVDAKCYEQSKSATTCDPTGSTTSFALMVANKAYQLDETGNAKATEAFKGRADRSSDPTDPPSSEVRAKITGSVEDNQTLKVDTIEIQ